MLNPAYDRDVTAEGACRMSLRILVATHADVLAVDAESGDVASTHGLGAERPTCLAADARVPGRVWCGTDGAGVFRSDDGGASWRAVGLASERVTAVTPSPTEEGVVWVGTEPSAIWCSGDAGASWERLEGLDALPSAPTWSFPPKPDTHHVRWIACHPSRAGRLWVAIEAGALIGTADGGRSWQDRVAGGPYDTHELAVHPDAQDVLRVSAGDGYYESRDGGVTWATPEDGLEVGYLRSVAMDPGDAETVVVSAATHPHVAYVAGHSDGRLYRRRGGGRWARVTRGWPEPPDTIAPLLLAGHEAGELWAGDERGVHRSADGGVAWEQVAGFQPMPHHLRGLALGYVG
jgi:photosystem II stability/assembly factor-like uncharacterized protein